MNFTNEAIEEIKSHLPEYLLETGRKTKGLFRCVNPEHTDTTPSMSYNPDNNTIRCFGSCEAQHRTYIYDLISLYALDNHLDNKLDFKRIVEELAKKYNVDLRASRTTHKEIYTQPKKSKTNYIKYYNQVKKNIDKTDYLTKRGISERLIKKYNIGYDIQQNEVIIPISPYFYVGRYASNDENFKHHKPKDAKQELFNTEYLRSSDFKTVVFITESIIDALSLEEVKPDIKAVALNGASNYLQVAEEIEKYNYKGAIVLALDTDTTGIRTSERLKEELDALNIQHVIIFNTSVGRYGEDIKDANEYLLANRDGLEKNISYFDEQIKTILKNQELKILEKENTLNYLDAFNEIVQDKELSTPLETGIPRLDKALGGGLYKKSLIILGATSGLGKTSLLLQIGDNVARRNTDVLIFSLEMAKEELIAKSLSRGMYLMAEKDNIATYKCYSHRDILSGIMYDKTSTNYEDASKLYFEALEDYKKNIAPHLFIAECNEDNEITIKDIEQRIKRQVDITEKKPLVIIDYLQIIENKEKGLTDIQATGKIVKDLKRLARKLKITIIVISAFNRTSYYADANKSSFRDTSTIEYTADVLLSMQYSVLDNTDEMEEGSDQKQQKKVKALVKEASKKDPKELTLKILKNRNLKPTDVKHIEFSGKNNYFNFREYDENFNRYND